jgi:hypothetical protein
MTENNTPKTALKMMTVAESTPATQAQTYETENGRSLSTRCRPIPRSSAGIALW